MRGGRDDVFAHAEVLLSSDFKGANGCNFRALAPRHYAVDLETEPGTLFHSHDQPGTGQHHM